jgi:ankyrin repeat protein
VEKGASVSTADNGGRTALMYACISGKLDLVKLLVRKDADVSARDHVSFLLLLLL